MAERLYPGVYIEERAGGPGPVQGVSTSNFGIVGFTLKGKTDEPIISTSFTEWAETFGDFTEQSLTPTEVYSFFQNGGRRVYTVRVVASDAVAADAFYSESVTAEAGPAGTGAVNYQFTFNKFPVVADSSVSITAGTVTFTDDGAGTLTGTGGGGGSGAIDYDTGEVSITLTTPSDFSSGNTASDYKYKTFEFLIQWAGEAGNNYRVRLVGSPDFEVITGGVSEAKYSRFDLYVEEYINEVWIVVETFTELVLNDPNDSNYILTVVNDDGTGSNIVEVVATGNNENPSALEGETKADQSVVIAPAYDGSEKAFDYTLPDEPYPTTLRIKCTMLEVGLLIGTGGGTATPTVTGPEGPIEMGDGTLVGAKVTLYCTLTTAGASTFYDDGAGKLTDDGTPTGDQIGTVVYTTGVITLDASGLTVTDTFVSGTAITLDCEYSNTVDLVDDGSGNMSVASDSTGPSKFELNSNETNEISYATKVVSVVWRIVGDPGAGPATGGTAVADYLTVPADSVTDQFENGADGTATSRADISAAALAAEDKGLYAFNKTDDLLNVIIADFQTDETVSGDLVDYCELRMDRFAILNIPEGFNPQESVNWKKTVWNKSSSYYAMYAPHVKIIDPVTDKTINIPSGGHVAGIYARTDITKNVSKAPAGASDGALRYITGLEQSWTQDQVGIVYPNKINALVDWPFIGNRVVWGARTGELAGGEFPYIQQRRLFMFLEKSIFNSTHIHVFENNGPNLWSRIRLQVENFLLGLFNENYFSGASPSEAFFVVCDSSNNNANTIAQGLVFCDVGVAPTYPAEFIVFRFQQKSLTS